MDLVCHLDKENPGVCDTAGVEAVHVHEKAIVHIFLEGFVVFLVFFPFFCPFFFEFDNVFGLSVLGKRVDDKSDPFSEGLHDVEVGDSAVLSDVMKNGSY